MKILSFFLLGMVSFNAFAAQGSLQCAKIGISEAQRDLSLALSNPSTPNYIRKLIGVMQWRASAIDPRDAMESPEFFAAAKVGLYNENEIRIFVSNVAVAKADADTLYYKRRVPAKVFYTKGFVKSCTAQTVGLPGQVTLNALAQMNFMDSCLGTYAAERVKILARQKVYGAGTNANYCELGFMREKLDIALRRMFE